MYTPNQQAQSAILKLWLYNKDYNPGYKNEDTSNNGSSHSDEIELFEEDDAFDDWED